MHSWWERIFGACEGCIARDYTIAILKEELHSKDGKIQEVEMRNDNLNSDIRRRLDFISGMNRALPNQNQAVGSNLTSVPRKGSMGDRIAHAERVDREGAQVISAQRKKEYEERIAAMERPETELVDNNAS